LVVATDGGLRSPTTVLPAAKIDLPLTASPKAMSKRCLPKFTVRLPSLEKLRSSLPLARKRANAKSSFVR